ncbi:pilus assembly protein [Hydrogenophaga sp.]|uniref:pilus assembly protein n=1 Tax=Hydrogenophaga sp. TaxID=1904254 RepID=UPI002731413A|nr:PilC/PilY family type IV pilus protein [Hydrogenophaga sp.]MDP2073170.1 PilC/PilY family type IV pilus protein [Hydrogenophaga sp.]MDP3109109.1 PilC/PilY family type IV pilus protein [Hydrogenophaga sp.]
MLDTTHFTNHSAARLLVAALVLLAVSAATAEPTQRPLLVNTSGAKPNLMISLDNSASMSIPYPDQYNVGSGSSRGAYWAAHRSAEVNHLYYNPRITYLPRVEADGKPMVPTDGIVFISNQASAAFAYRVFADTSTPQPNSSYVVQHGSYANLPSYPNSWSEVSQETEPGYAPRHTAYTASDIKTTTPAFTYAVCSAISTNASDQKCTTWRFVDVSYGSTAAIVLPPDHRRTECGPTSCTTAQEIQNILNWYRYYLYRMPATATAIGQALSDPRLNNRIRVGYLPINYLKEALSLTPGTAVTQPHVLRGVRTWVAGSNDNRQVYDWLYKQMPMGATPLHNAVEKVASYLQVPTGARENPWAVDPSQLASATNPEMSCRRSFNLVFSDGAWSSSTSTIKGKDFDNTPGPTFERTGSNPLTTFSFKPTGPTERKLYTPYPSTATGGMADLTAQYYWHKDLRDKLANQVATRAGQPAFWQNMTTYTVGYLIKPSGLLVGASSGLTFDQIDAYRTGFVMDGYNDAPKPSWPTGDTTSLTEARRIDDFIQAGYTGGGRGFSVQTAEDIRGVFDTILSDILNAAGSDAGIELSNSGIATTTLAGLLKYGVDYRTIDNSGEVTAKLLNAAGNAVVNSTDVNGNVLSPPSDAYWTASKQMPNHADRHVFSMSSLNGPFEFKGSFSLLPVDVQTSLKVGKDKDRIPNDSRFVDYLRGKEAVADVQNRLFRPRLSPIGAVVNAPPLLMGANDNMRYDIDGTVSGRQQYAAYREKIRTSATSLLVATNAGVVHAFSGDKGKELAAFMPRRSMAKLLDQANLNAGFEYTLDGPLTSNDIYSGNDWNQVALGTGGRGTKMIYALRSPLNANGDRTPGANDFLWEVGPDSIDDTSVTSGYMTNPVRSGQTDSGHWVAVVNSGHYNGQSGGAKAGLVLLNALTGEVLRNIPLPATYSAGRGLGGVTLVRDTRKRIVAAYAADANGNLWRFDLRGDPAAWKVSYGKPLFTTKNNRPIYGAPAWQAHPKGGFIVVVATGIVLEDSDLSDTSLRESIYGIWDPTSSTGQEKAAFDTVLPSSLVEQQMVQLETKTGTESYFSISRKPVDWETQRGWSLSLGHTHSGERSIDQVRNIGSSVLINTTVLNSSTGNNTESCTAANLPSNYLYLLNALDGAGNPAFDADRDGTVDNTAVVLLEAGGFTRSIETVDISESSGLRQTKGIQTQSGEDEYPPPELPGGGIPDIPSCRGAKEEIAGQGSQVVRAVVECPTGDSSDDLKGTPKSWSRQQYQLTRPPL